MTPRESPLREAQLESVFLKSVRLAGGVAVKLAPTARGVPDRLVLLHGSTYLVELKTETGRLSPVQEHWHHRAAQAGVAVVVLRGVDDVRRWVQERGRAIDPPARPDTYLVRPKSPPCVCRHARRTHEAPARAAEAPARAAEGAETPPGPCGAVRCRCPSWRAYEAPQTPAETGGADR
jgi:hypothetical protein